MDTATLSALIKSFGAADTPENTNRIREFYANDPKAAENRLTGARAPSDESGGSRDMMLNSMLDKVIAQTMGSLQQVAPQESLQPLPMVQNASTPSVRSATAARGPRGVAPNMEPQMQPGYNDNTEVTSGTIGAPPASGDMSMWDMLGLLFGAGATGKAFLGQPNANARGKGAGAGGAGSANKRITSGQVPESHRLTYQPKLEDDTGRFKKFQKDFPGSQSMSDVDIVRQQHRLTPEEATSVMNQDAQNVARIKQEVDAENAQAKALQDQMMEREMRQRGTRDLAKAARRATGRK